MEDSDEDGILLDNWVCKLCHRRCVNVPKCPCGIDPLPQSNSSFGYSIDKFSEQDQEALSKFDLTCSICSGVICDPVRFTKCEHTFCNGCVVRFLATTGDRRFSCPLCKSCTTFRTAKFVRRVLNKLKIRCDFDGCTHRTTVDKIHSHIETCIKNPHTKCNHCDMVYERKKRRQHLKTYCRLKCEFCHKSFLRSAMSYHKQRCLKNPYIICQYCGKKVQRKDLRDHWRRTCEMRNEKVTCPEKLCGMRVSRHELEAHQQLHPFGVKGQVFCTNIVGKTMILYWHPKQTIGKTLDIIADRLSVDRRHLSLFRNVRKLGPGTFEECGIENEATLNCRFSKLPN